MSEKTYISESSQSAEFESMDDPLDALRRLLSKPAGHGDIVIKISVEFCSKEKTENLRTIEGGD